MNAWHVPACDKLKQPSADDLELLVAELAEMRRSAQFLAGRDLTTAALTVAIQDGGRNAEGSANVCDLRSDLSRLHAELSSLDPAAIVALRIFTHGSHLFSKRFDDLRTASSDMLGDSAVLKRASGLILSVANDLELLISSGDVKLSSFEALAAQLRAAVNSLGGRSEEDELAMVRDTVPCSWICHRAVHSVLSPFPHGRFGFMLPPVTTP
jgi:hypothetical protein